MLHSSRIISVVIASDSEAIQTKPQPQSPRLDRVAVARDAGWTAPDGIDVPNWSLLRFANQR
jgi:hypothetical protein